MINVCKANISESEMRQARVKQPIKPENVVTKSKVGHHVDRHVPA